MKDIVAGGVGGVMFGVLYLAFGIPLPFAAAGAVAGYVAGRFIASRSRAQGTGMDFGNDADAAAQMIAEGEKQVKNLKSIADSIQKPEIREKAQGLASLAKRIVDGLQESPKDAKRVRQFLNYYLGTTCTILQRYAELTSRNITSNEVSAALAKVEGMLDSIQHVFEQQLAAAAQDDVLDLDTELGLLEQTLKMESLNRAQ